MFCIPDQAKRSRMEVGRHGMIFQHPAVTPLGSPGVPLQQLMPTAQGRSAVASWDRSALVTVIQCCWRSGFIPEFPKLIPPFFQASSTSCDPLIGTPFKLSPHLKSFSSHQRDSWAEDKPEDQFGRHHIFFIYDFPIISLSHSPHPFKFFFAIKASLISSSAHRMMRPKLSSGMSYFT